MASLQEPPHHVCSHPAQTHHAKLHKSLLCYLVTRTNESCPDQCDDNSSHI
ncbi:hypothetical protein ACPOL_1803 [Acidisarcina polymorpha]|uniref:Uncharacterized protein n=1 Tax=Acidisarcina polymorpha TaxID=2211140 RepID=A0A2Z5FXN8_9BACT|nr:hypothetical protein ACPOL_1803 [Acidisarcina polymorpha]